MEAGEGGEAAVYKASDHSVGEGGGKGRKGGMNIGGRRFLCVLTIYTGGCECVSVCAHL